jgi:hypothetical protein
MITVEISELKWENHSASDGQYGTLSWKEDGKQRFVAMPVSFLVNLYKEAKNKTIDSDGNYGNEIIGR